MRWSSQLQNTGTVEGRQNDISSWNSSRSTHLFYLILTSNICQPSDVYTRCDFLNWKKWMPLELEFILVFPIYDSHKIGIGTLFRPISTRGSKSPAPLKGWHGNPAMYKSAAGTSRLELSLDIRSSSGLKMWLCPLCPLCPVPSKYLKHLIFTWKMRCWEWRVDLIYMYGSIREDIPKKKLICQWI